MESIVLGHNFLCNSLLQFGSNFDSKGRGQFSENALPCINTKTGLFRESSVSKAKMPEEGAEPDPVRKREDIPPEVFDGQKYLVRQI